MHTPEFAFEKDEGNVRRATENLGVAYPVALDNGYAIWRAFKNRYWPAHYFIDADGLIRGHHFGEGEYDRSEALIRRLLVDAGAQDLPPPLGGIEAEGVQSASDFSKVGSPETYVGYGRASEFISPGGFARDVPNDYASPDVRRRNEWALDGRWTVRREDAMLDAPGGRITMRFRARDLHLVLGPATDGKPVRFRVTLDGEAPGSGPRHGRQRRRRRHGARAAPVPADPPVRRHRRPDLHHRVSRPGRAGICIHLRLTPHRMPR